MKSHSGRSIPDMKLVLRNAQRLSGPDLADLYNFMKELEESDFDGDPEVSACREKLFILLAEKGKALFDSLSKEDQAEFIKELVEAKRAILKKCGNEN